VRYNRVHDFVFTSGQRGQGVIVGVTTGTQVNTNLIWNIPHTAGGSCGISLSSGPSHTVYYNSVSNVASEGIVNEVNTTGAILRNNIAYQCGTNFRNSGASPTADHNITTQNPLWTSSSNFHLLAGSPAINGGITIAGITTDFDGVTRGNPPDIGAYEFV
jgi:hypothetical protein